MLPKIETPRYKLEIPSSKERVEYRPFLVKEEKILLTAMESARDLHGNEFEEQVRDVVVRIISNCTEGKVDANKLPAFDVDYLFLNIRAKSRGEEIHPSYTCRAPNEDGGQCGHVNEFMIPLSDITVEFPDDANSKVMVTDDIGIQFKYMTTEEMKVHNKEKNEVEKMFRIIVDSIDYIFDADKMYKASETPKRELMDFVEQLNEEVFEKVRLFFAQQPVLKHTFEYKCEKCGYKEDVTLEGLEDFFGFA